MRKIRERILTDILKLVKIQSFTDDWLGIRKCQEEVQEIAHKLGFVTFYHANGKVLVIEPKDLIGRPELGIVVHLDTVPYDETQWTHNPLGEIANGRVYGRGVIDDKAAIILALYALYSNAKKPNWQIIVGSCEEGVWTDMQDYMKEEVTLPEFLITIDGDGVQNGCRGYLDLECSFKRNNLSCNRLTDLVVVDGANNSVPGKAIAIIENRKIEMIGVAVHSSIPETGKNALTHLLCQIREEVGQEFPGLFNLAYNLKDECDAMCVGFKKHPEVLYGQRIGNTSICLTNCEYSENEITVNLNIRLCAGVNQEEVETAIQKISSEYECVCQIKELTLPAYISPESWGIQKMLESYKEVMGKETTSTIAMGVGYNAALPNCAIFGPRFAVEHDEEDTCHAANENRTIEDLFKFYEMLCIFLNKF